MQTSKLDINALTAISAISANIFLPMIFENSWISISDKSKILQLNQYWNKRFIKNWRENVAKQKNAKRYLSILPLRTLSLLMQEENLDWVIALENFMQFVKAKNQLATTLPTPGFLSKIGLKKRSWLEDIANHKPPTYCPMGESLISYNIKNQEVFNVVLLLINKYELNKLYDCFSNSQNKTTLASPLSMAAVYNESLGIAQLLLSIGADVNWRKDPVGCTPLHYAIGQNKPRMAELLLNYGANPELTNPENRTPLHALLQKEMGIVATFLQIWSDFNIPINNELAEKLLKKAIKLKEKSPDAVKVVALLQSKLIPQPRLLLWACRQNAKDENAYLAIMQNEIKKGEDINTLCTDREQSLLHVIVQHTDHISKRFQWLLDQGIDADDQDKEGNTPLHLAIIHNLHVVQPLLTARAPINLKNSEGNTALHLTVTSNAGTPASRLEVLQLLLAHGADPCLQNEAGYSALHLAVIHAQLDYIPLLANTANIKTASGDTPLHLAIHDKTNDKLVQALLALPNIDVNATDNSGWTALHIAAHTYCPENILVIKLLLTAGANALAVDYQGWTALHRAVQKRHTDVVPILIAHDLKTLLIKNNDGDTPRDLANRKGLRILANLLSDQQPMLLLWNQQRQQQRTLAKKNEAIPSGTTKNKY